MVNRVGLLICSMGSRFAIGALSIPVFLLAEGFAGNQGERVEYFRLLIFYAGTSESAMINLRLGRMENFGRNLRNLFSSSSKMRRFDSASVQLTSDLTQFTVEHGTRLTKLMADYKITGTLVLVVAH